MLKHIQSKDLQSFFLFNTPTVQRRDMHVNGHIPRINTAEEREVCQYTCSGEAKILCENSHNEHKDLFSCKHQDDDISSRYNTGNRTHCTLCTSEPWMIPAFACTNGKYLHPRGISKATGLCRPSLLPVRSKSNICLRVRTGRAGQGTGGHRTPSMARTRRGHPNPSSQGLTEHFQWHGHS